LKRRGPGRPSVMENPRQITIRIEKRDYELLKRMAFERGKYPTEFIREILTDFLKKELSRKDVLKKGD